MSPFTTQILAGFRSELARAEFALKVREKDAEKLRATIAELKMNIQRIEQREGERDKSAIN